MIKVLVPYIYVWEKVWLGKTQAIWPGGERQSLTKYLPHIKIDWNPPKFKILGVWLTADLIDCEEINYNNIFSEIKILFNIWIKRTIMPLGKIAIWKSLILFKFVQLWLLLPNPPDGFIDRLQNMYLSSYGTENKIGLAETVMKSIQKGEGKKLK